jgi:hypothetical protein
MALCIICREEKNNLTEEHVIPDSIGGYYKIYTVCKTCNEHLGENIDLKLTNHKFIEFHRHLNSIKGKKGSIPNPFSGTHKLSKDIEQKVHLIFDNDGKLKPIILPKIPRINFNSLSSSFEIIVDKKDESKVDEIIDKIAKRNGIKRENIIIKDKHYHSEQPEVKMQLKIDVKDFQMGVLKIAYEFAVDSIPAYFDSSDAKNISKILYDNDITALDNRNIFLNDGFNKEKLKFLESYIEFDSNNHYLFLIDDPNDGLIVIVKIFDTFVSVIRLGASKNYLNDDYIFGINYTARKKFVKLNLQQVTSKVYSPVNYRFQYFIPFGEEKEFFDLEQNPNFGFFQINGSLPLFDSIGKMIYNDILDKLGQEQLLKINRGNMPQSLITEVVFDEEVFIKLLPNDKIYRILSVALEQFLVNKL